MNNRGDHFVQSLERGLSVIRAFGPDDPELTLSDVARRTGLTRAARVAFDVSDHDVTLHGSCESCRTA